MTASVPCAYRADTPQKNRFGTGLNSLAVSNVPTNHEVVLNLNNLQRDGLHEYRCSWSCISFALLISCSLGPYFYRRMIGRCVPH